MRRRARLLSGEERALWAAVARFVNPLPGRAAPEPQPALAAAEPVSDPPPFRPPEPARMEPARAPPPARFQPLERRTARALARGRLATDAALDLHGMTQAEAHGALRRFLVRSQANGATLVLVVTGKGAPDRAQGPAGSPDERGILRRVVPLWLASPDLRPLVVGFEEAAARRGGVGALYVRLRRGGRS